LAGFLKILSLLVVAAGAFLVYGSGFLAEKTEKNHGDYQSGNAEHNMDTDTGEMDNENAVYENNGITQKSLSFKKAGLLLIMAGSILVLIAFR